MQAFNQTKTRRCGYQWSAAATLIILSLAMIPAGIANADVYRVGSAGDTACTHSSIELALLAAFFNSGADEIRIATNQSYTGQGFAVSNQSVTLVGGYSSCADTTPSTSGTTLDGAGGGVEPIIDISRTSGASMNVVIRYLNLQNSDAEGVSISGTSLGVTMDTVRITDSADDGVLISDTNQLVTLTEVDVIGSGSQGVRVSGLDAWVSLEAAQMNFNASTGLWAENGATVTVDHQSLISNNTGSSGAGVRCVNAVMDIAGAIFNNTASSTGGGIRAEGSCNMDVQSTNAFGTIFNNTSGVNGGGIYAIGGAYVRVNGHVGRAWIHHNRANNVGGGVYAAGTGTFVEIYNAEIVNNSAGYAGGGIFATDNAGVLTDRFGYTCHDPYRCMTLSGNTLDIPGDGSALHARLGADVTLLQTFIEDNSNGFLVFAQDSGTTLELETVQLWNNDAGALLEIESGAVMTAGFLSAAGNTNGVLDVRLVQTSSATASLYSSVFDDISGVAISGGSFTADCIITNDLSGFPTSTSIVQYADPLFNDAATGDLHLQAGSPAIDFCDTFYFAPTQADMDFDTRGFDDPTRGDQFGPFDLGVDEAMGQTIFMDDFESGNTSAWTFVVP